MKQSHCSVVCGLDLKGFNAELAVISGRIREVGRMHEAMSAAGRNPDQWLPIFLGSVGAETSTQRGANNERQEKP